MRCSSPVCLSACLSVCLSVCRLWDGGISDVSRLRQSAGRPPWQTGTDRCWGGTCSSFTTEQATPDTFSLRTLPTAPSLCWAPLLCVTSRKRCCCFFFVLFCFFFSFLYLYTVRGKIQKLTRMSNKKKWFCAKVCNPDSWSGRSLEPVRLGAQRPPSKSCGERRAHPVRAEPPLLLRLSPHSPISQEKKKKQTFDFSPPLLVLFFTTILSSGKRKYHAVSFERTLAHLCALL